MKITKTLSTLSTAALLCAFSLQALSATLYERDGTYFDVFGTIEAGYLGKYGANPDRYYHTDGNNNSVYAAMTLGLSARTRLTEGLDGIAMVQWDMPDGELETQTNYLYVGIDAYQYGTLIAGKSENAYYAVAGLTDIYNFLDQRGNDFYVAGDKLPGQIMYRLSALSWDLRLAYQTAKDRVNDTPISIRYGYSASLSTQIAKVLTVAYGLSYTNFSYAGSENSEALIGYFAPIFAHDRKISEADARALVDRQRPTDKYDYGLGLAYGVLGDGLYASFNYTQTDYDYLKHDLHTYDLALNYTFDGGWSLYGGLTYQQYDSFFITEDLNLGVSYKFNPNFIVYAEASIDLGAQPERFYGSNVKPYMGEDRYVLGAKLSF